MRSTSVLAGTSPGSIDAWVGAVSASGTATEDELDAATAAARARSTPSTDPEAG